MIRITRQTDYGIVLLTRFAAEPERTLAARELSGEARLPLPMVSKTLKRLARGGLLASRRGARGGYVLARPAAAITVADAIRVLEGPIAMTECGGGADGGCAQEGHCGVSGHWQVISRAVRVALESVTLADMARPAVAGLLSIAPRRPRLPPPAAAPDPRHAPSTERA